MDRSRTATQVANCSPQFGFGQNKTEIYELLMGLLKLKGKCGRSGRQKWTFIVIGQQQINGSSLTTRRQCQAATLVFITQRNPKATFLKREQ